MTVLATQLAGSADLDVVTVKDIPGYANLINLDYLKPLNEVLTRDTGDFNGTIEQLTTDDGNFYAVPFRSDFWVLYYNKDLFDKAGVEYPSNDLTMEDYDALARKMTSGSGDTKVYGCHYHTWRSAASLFSILDGKNTIIDGKYDFMKPPTIWSLLSRRTASAWTTATSRPLLCTTPQPLRTSSAQWSTWAAGSFPRWKLT